MLHLVRKLSQDKLNYITNLSTKSTPKPTFMLKETIQKALRMVDETSLGFDPLRFDLELNRRGSAAATECQGAGRGWCDFVA